MCEQEENTFSLPPSLVSFLFLSLSLDQIKKMKEKEKHSKKFPRLACALPGPFIKRGVPGTGSGLTGATLGRLGATGLRAASWSTKLPGAVKN